MKNRIAAVGVAFLIGCGGGSSPGLSGDAFLGDRPEFRQDEASQETFECRTREDCPVVPCAAAVCLNGRCQYEIAPPGTTCSDLEACIPNGVCDGAGKCNGEWACDDHNPCTEDKCENATCINLPLDAVPCDDGDPCTHPDVCAKGKCEPGELVCECRDDADCPKPTNLCLGRLVCDQTIHKCVPDPQEMIQCPKPQNPCLKNECVPETGSCKESVIPDGTPCDLGICFVDAKCQGGECIGTPKCVSTDPCRLASCNEQDGSCTYSDVKDGTPCDDNNPCTPNDRCQAGVCKGDPPPPETCNGVDDDCDGFTDPENSLGCKVYYWDADSDGFGTSEKSKCLCDPTGSYRATAGGDCDDFDPQIFPGAKEKCDDKDNDCDGNTDPAGADGCTVFYKDADNDGYGIAGDTSCLCKPQPPYTVSIAGDCNDNDSEINPAKPEVCNQVDDNCDGVTDPEGSPGCHYLYKDADGDSYGSGDPKCLCAPQGQYTASVAGDCNDANASVNPGALEVCNGIDDNCDGLIDPENTSGCQVFYKDADQDGYGVTNDKKCLCTASAPYTANKAGDCNDTDPTVNPGANEVCNGKDDNCDGMTDPEGTPGCKTYYKDADGDGYGVSGDSKCLCVPTGTYTALQAGDCNDADARVHPGGSVCGMDGDCDGNPLDVGEECEDGNAVDWDGCTNACRIGEFQVNSYASYDQERPAVAFPLGSSNQGYYVAWEGIGCYGFLCSQVVPGVWLARFSATGSLEWTRIANTYYLGTQGEASVAAHTNSDVGAVVVWHGDRAQNLTDDILGRRFKEDGTAKESAPIVVNQVTANLQKQPSVAIEPGGGFWAVWTTFKGQNAQNDIALRVFSDQAVGGNELTVNTTQDTDESNPDIASCDFYSKYVVVWQSGPAGSESVYFRRYDYNATPLDPSQRLASVSATGSQINPRVAGNNLIGGGFVITWFGVGPGGKTGIWARVFLAVGTPVDPEVLVAEGSDVGSPDVAMAGDGSFVVVWVRGGDVYMRRYNKDQTPKGNAFVVNLYTAGFQGYPAVASALDGTTLVAWQSYLQDGSGYGIFAQRFGPNGERLYR